MAWRGGALYQLGATLRSLENPSLTLDLKPSFTAEELALKIQHASSDLLDAALKSWKLSPVGVSLLKHFSDHHAIRTPLSLAKAAKRISIPLTAPRPLAEAISSAGGVLFSELDDSLMMKRLPGLFVAGEMMDWEAPTGGYLLQGCFATGTRAAKGAIAYLENKQS
jgi:predicted flavoprotein YhiN